MATQPEGRTDDEVSGPVVAEAIPSVVAEVVAE